MWWMERDVLEAFIIVSGNPFVDGKQNFNKGCHSKPVLDGSEQNLFIWYKSHD